MYEKRLCILKQIKKGFSADGAPITGAVYAERLGEELTVTPRIAGLAPLKEGRYALAVWAGGRTYCLELKGNAPLRAPGAPSLDGGFSALVCFVRGSAEPVAYGFCGGAPSDFSPLLELFSGRQRTSVPMPPNQLPGSPSPQVPLAPGVPLPEPEEGERDSAAAGYDDEAIAEADYFEGETSPRAEEEGESVPPFGRTRGGLTYYREIEPKLREEFARRPRDERLSGVFPNSEWVQSSGALLGVIYEEGLPRYLCVAMERDPPPEVREYSVFVPLTPYSDERGMFVVFQDADTGEYVRAEEA